MFQKLKVLQGQGYLDWDVYVIEQLRVVLDGRAGGEEHHDLLAEVALEEGEQQQEALLGGHHAVPLLQPLACGQHLLVVHPHIQRLALERQPRQVLYLQGA